MMRPLGEAHSLPTACVKQGILFLSIGIAHWRGRTMDLTCVLPMCVKALSLCSLALAEVTSASM